MIVSISSRVHRCFAPALAIAVCETLAMILLVGQESCQAFFCRHTLNVNLNVSWSIIS